MQYSHKLKKAAEEIKEIMAKYDIAGAITIHTPGFTEFVLNITPTYSCAWVQGNQLRMRALKKDFDSHDEWKQKVMDTSDMLHSLAIVTERNHEMLKHASVILDNAIGATHEDLGFTSHDTQNN